MSSWFLVKRHALAFSFVDVSSTAARLARSRLTRRVTNKVTLLRVTPLRASSAEVHFLYSTHNVLQDEQPATGAEGILRSRWTRFEQKRACSAYFFCLAYLLHQPASKLWLFRLQRKEAFRRLLNLAQEPDSFSKKLVTEKVKDFFVDFPELQDEAINIVYDMCEDQDQEVRIIDWRSVSSMSGSRLLRFALLDMVLSHLCRT